MNLNRLIVVNNYKVVLFKEKKRKEKKKMATDLSSFCLICDVCVSMMRKQFVSLFVCLSKLSFFFPSFLIFYFTNLSLFCGVQWIDLVRCEKQLPIHFGLLFPCIQNIYYIILYYIIVTYVEHYF